MENRYCFDLPGCDGPVDVEDLDRLCVFGQDIRVPQKENNYNENLIYESENNFRQRPFSYCTEERWLTCTVNNCPLYDTSYYLNSSTVLPCAENFYHFDPYDCYGGNSNIIFNSESDFEDYLSNEKRKEKSRDAARCRRSRETDIFTDLAGVLPMTTEQAAHLDKASVMRLAIAYLKVRALVDCVPTPLSKAESPSDFDEFFLKALDGFMLVLSNNGDMVYLSENVSEYLGVSQMDMMGQSVYEYSHPCDHDELRESLSTKFDEAGKQSCNFFLRLKCTLTNKGRKVNLKSASYKVIHCTGQIVSTPQIQKSLQTENGSSNEASGGEEETENELMASLVVVGCPVPHPSNIEVPLGRQTFLSKHNLNMKFTYADEKLAEYLGWESSELVGQSAFDFYHAQDNGILNKSFKSLFSKGQCETMAYRFLGKKGGYAWVITQATLIYCLKQHKPQSVVCVNYIVSGVECEDEIYSIRQLEAREVSINEKALDNNLRPPLLEIVDLLESRNILEQRPTPKVQIVKPQVGRQFLEESNKKDENIFNDLINETEENFVTKNNNNNQLKEISILNQENDISEQDKSEEELEPIRSIGENIENYPYFPPTSTAFGINQDQLSQLPLSQTATASIFAPRTEDMNTGFLTYSEDQPGLTMLKDEPEDLTHLAPTAGDVCVPLEDPPFLSDMLDEFILENESYCPLLSSELQTEVSDLTDSALRNQELLSDSLKNKDLDISIQDRDPFIYRDSPSRGSCSTELYSPTLSRSPERSIDSLCSPSGSGNGFSEDEMLMLSITDVMADDELALRAPYIPMSDQDEALELLINNDMVMWGPTQLNDKKSKWNNDLIEEKKNSSLAQLLRNESSARKFKDHGGDMVNPSHVLGQIRVKGKELESDRLCSERSNKRVHGYSIKSENEYKRIKCERAENFENNQIITNQLQEGSQLLQRLVTSDNMSKHWQNQLDMRERLLLSKDDSSDISMQNCEMINPQLLGKNDISNLNLNRKRGKQISSQWLSSPNDVQNQMNKNLKNDNSNRINRDWPTIMSTTNFDILPFEIPKYLQESDILSLDQNLV
ncbi:hypoxia-inducible factor 1-alpha-like isoform X2 [Leptopilina boulardi]|uniref:hypoxia-inducible factor 1-alpha-like isoform X2 n=1 Tax=Leptopilina boulardi TaxID=63433 RepID=UPI0021F60D1C|nr:hypoxia-inducible factor 1-alpha-like isoform X2 [Leptopilina boulardi]